MSEPNKEYVVNKLKNEIQKLRKELEEKNKQIQMLLQFIGGNNEPIS